MIDREKMNAWQEQNPLRKWRKVNNVTQMQVASLAEVSSTTLMKWENGVVSPSAESFLTLASLMGVIVGDLMVAWINWKANINV